MQNAIEFIAKKKNGGLIQIPKEFIDEVTGEFRVILLLNQPTQKKDIIKPKKEFNALKVELNEYKFNRDDAYDE
jgi:hypothetical protein